MTKKLKKQNQSKDGWILNYRTLSSLRSKASEIWPVCEEEVEATLLAAISQGYANIDSLRNIDDIFEEAVNRRQCEEEA